MPESTSYNLEAVQSDGFVDFYELLGMPSSASTEELREQIQTLYAEAQANRDHRNLNKRRDYQTLLEYLPQARTALLEDDKRRRYDEYVAEVRSGSGAPQTFEAFMGELSGQVVDNDRTDVLGIQEGTGRATVTTRAAQTSTSTGGTSPRPTRKPQVQSGTQQGLMGSAIAVIVFTLTLAVLWLIMHSFPIALMIAAVAGIVTWFATRPRGGGRIAR